MTSRDGGWLADGNGKWRVAGGRQWVAGAGEGRRGQVVGYGWQVAGDR